MGKYENGYNKKSLIFLKKKTCNNDLFFPFILYWNVNDQIRYGLIRPSICKRMQFGFCWRIVVGNGGGGDGVFYINDAAHFNVDNVVVAALGPPRCTNNSIVCSFAFTNFPHKCGNEFYPSGFLLSEMFHNLLYCVWETSSFRSKSFHPSKQIKKKNSQKIFIIILHGCHRNIVLPPAASKH